MNAELILGVDGYPVLDLVDQCSWEDSADIEFISLEEAGLEESSHEPIFGLQDSPCSSIQDYTSWWLEGDSELQIN